MSWEQGPVASSAHRSAFYFACLDYRVPTSLANDAGYITIGQISLIYSLPDAMPNIAATLGPEGSDGYTNINALTDGDFTESNSWFIAVQDPDDPISFTIDLQVTTYRLPRPCHRLPPPFTAVLLQDSTTQVCGFTMFWPTDNYAQQWKIYYGASGDRQRRPSMLWIPPDPPTHTPTQHSLAVGDWGAPIILMDGALVPPGSNPTTPWVRATTDRVGHGGDLPAFPFDVDASVRQRNTALPCAIAAILPKADAVPL